MGKKILRCGIKRRRGYLYYIDKDGDVCETAMLRQGLPMKLRLTLRAKRKKKLAAARIRNMKLLV